MKKKNASLLSSTGDAASSSSVAAQQATSSTPSATYVFTEWMKLKDCFDYLAKMMKIQIPMHGLMQRTFNRIFSNMNNELLGDFLIDQSDLLRSIITLVALDDNVCTDNNSISVFTNDPTCEQHIFLLYHQNKQLFAVYVSLSNGVANVCIDDNDKEVACNDITDCIAKWNGSISAKNKNHVNDNVVTQRPSGDDDVYLPASKVLQMRLQLTCELISRISEQLDQTKLKNESGQTLLNAFDRSSDSEKMNLIANELATSLENFRMAVPSHHEEQREEISSMETDDERMTNGTTDVATNVNHSIVPEEQIVHDQLNLLERKNQSLTEYAAPQILKQPTQYQRVRMFSDLASSTCPMIQAGDKRAAQQTYVEIEVPRSNGTDLYVRVAPVTTVELSKHPHKAVVPENPTIDLTKIETDGERKCLKGDQGTYNPAEECAYLPITPEERTKRQKQIKAYLIRWRQPGGGSKTTAKNANHSLCKLEFCFCIRTNSGSYRSVSPKSYSSIIDEADGLVTIRENPNQTRDICDRGGQTIDFELSVKCLQRDLVIVYNDKSLSKQNYQIRGKQLLVTTPAKEANAQHLDLTIARDEYNDASKANIRRILFSGVFNYVSHEHDALGSHQCAEQKLSSVKK